MAFDPEKASQLLAACHRRCCICHRFCGIKMELDHIRPRGERGSDDIENAIPVCFECHAEIHLYNPAHPRGRRFREGELRLHKEQWLKICKESPLQVVDNPRVTDVGPLHSLIDELEFNQGVAARKDVSAIGCPFEVAQFDRAIHAGLVSLLEPRVRDALYDCYALLKRANERLRACAYAQTPAGLGMAQTYAQQDIMAAGQPIALAREKLLVFLSADGEGNRAVATGDLGS